MVAIYLETRMSIMEIKQLEGFIHVAEFGSLSRAATILDTTQFALSRLVRQLESELQQPVASNGPLRCSYGSRTNCSRTREGDHRAGRLRSPGFGGATRRNCWSLHSGVNAQHSAGHNSCAGERLQSSVS